MAADNTFLKRCCIMATKDFSILNLFSPDEIQEKADGNYKTLCPSCKTEVGDYGGFTLFVKTNTSYCHAAAKWFTLQETYALIKGILSCKDGRDSNE